MNVRAYLYTRDGWPLGECRMKDISDGGAQLVISEIEDLPKELMLSLSRDGRVRRECEVVWHRNGAIGVRFVTS
jgi:hypothetical protein